MVDDRSSTVSLPEVPLLGVLPGTGGLTRVTDKRKVRRDLADIFCTTSEGVRADRAKDWKLIDAHRQAAAVRAAAWPLKSKRCVANPTPARRAAGHRADAAASAHRRGRLSLRARCDAQVDRDSAHRDASR